MRLLIIKTVKIITIALIIALPYSCDLDSAIDGAVNKIVAAMNEAVTSMDQNSAEYQNILNNLLVSLENIDQDVSIMLRRDIRNMLDRIPAAVGAEYRCNQEFVGGNMGQQLRCIQRDFMTMFGYNGAIPKPECAPSAPAICAVVPSAIQISLDPQVIDIYGFNFDQGIGATLADTAGTETDISQFLAMPSHYHMTLNLGMNGVSNLSSIERLLFTHDDTLLSSISIIIGESCTTINPGSRTFTQPVTNPMTCSSDGFAGAICKILKQQFESTVGINLSTTLTIANSSTRLVAATNAQYIPQTTTISSTKTPATRYTNATDTFSVYAAPPGAIISRITTDAQDSMQYIDTTAGPNYIERGNFGPVRQYELHLAVVQNSGYIKTTFNSFQVCTIP